jgi:hypothetical protein
VPNAAQTAVGPTLSVAFVVDPGGIGNEPSPGALGGSVHDAAEHLPGSPFWTQAVPSAAPGFVQAPDPGSHAPATWHESLAAHVTGFAPTHAPATHASVCVHAFPSLHVVPSAAVGLLHAPVVVSHVPATWH